MKAGRKGEGSVCIVTGASTGIGKATAELLADAGMRLALVARRKEKLQKLAKACGASAHVFSADVRKPREIQKVVMDALEFFGRIDVLINAAGVLASGELDRISEEKTVEILETNLLGTVLFSRAVLPSMKAEKKGHIVNVSSVAGTRPQLNMAAYTASKFGVMGFSDSLALEVKSYGIKVSTIRPGTVATELWKETWSKEDFKNAANSTLVAQDVARAILFAIEQPARVVVRDLFVAPST